jgi:hypothetical protein
MEAVAFAVASIRTIQLGADMKERFLSIERDPKGRFPDDALVTIEETPNWFERFFLKRETQLVQYFGDCTVWHRVSDGRRCDLGYEYWFSQIWEKWSRDGRA